MIQPYGSQKSHHDQKRTRECKLCNQVYEDANKLEEKRTLFPKNLKDQTWDKNGQFWIFLPIIGKSDHFLFPFLPERKEDENESKEMKD